MMRLAFLLLIASAVHGQSLSNVATVNVSMGGGGSTGFTLVQAPSNIACSSLTTATTHTCTVNTKAIGAGNGLLVMTTLFEDGTNGSPPSYNTVSGDSALVHCTGGGASIERTTTGNYSAVDCAQTSTATGGGTSITITWNTPALTGTYLAIDVVVFEFRKNNGGVIAFDTANTSTTASCSSCTGPTLSLTGTNEFTVQSWADFADPIAGPTTGVYIQNPVLVDQGNVTSGFAFYLQATAGTAMTTTQNSATVYAANAVAFK
jgi:hypothetical protein